MSYRADTRTRARGKFDLLAEQEKNRFALEIVARSLRFVVGSRKWRWSSDEYHVKTERTGSRDEKNGRIARHRTCLTKDFTAKSSWLSSCEVFLSVNYCRLCAREWSEHHEDTCSQTRKKREKKNYVWYNIGLFDSVVRFSFSFNVGLEQKAPTVPRVRSSRAPSDNPCENTWVCVYVKYTRVYVGWERCIVSSREDCTLHSDVCAITPARCRSCVFAESEK